MKKELLRDMGERFYGWHKGNKVKFVYGTEGKDLDREIEHIRELIEYVKKKKERLLQQQSGNL